MHAPRPAADADRTDAHVAAAVDEALALVDRARRGQA